MGLITNTHFAYYNNSQKFTATASQTEFLLTLDPLPANESEFIIRIDGSEVDDDLYNYSSTGGNAGKVIFTAGIYL